MIRRLLCLLGFHKYTFFETPFGERHYCIYCGHWEEEKEYKEYLKGKQK